ncbi:uncharacterized protein LOC131155844 [Malania oleifera]|uniref:uncharacterized protein LOC131155844 n=1 Tax=Malania oleifera TaxID=397392 RepID=UPI0025AEA645|nr:uncharacterized protein LOC131155844 [Malania oleifera]
MLEYDQTIEDLDEYEKEEGEDGVEEVEEEEECEEEEPPKPTKEELEYLELRQRLKERFRKKMKKENGSTQANCPEKRKKLSYDNYGSFFGPSKSVIAQRVIQESKLFLETRHLASKNKNGFASTAARPSQPTMTNEKLQDTRDYSFLLSDDAELPVPPKESQPRNGTVSNSGVLFLHCSKSGCRSMRFKAYYFHKENLHSFPYFSLMLKTCDFIKHR